MVERPQTLTSKASNAGNITQEGHMETPALKMNMHTYIESIPSALGFVPAGSLVASGFTSRSRVSGSMRIDLPTQEGQIGTYCDQVLRALAQAKRTDEWREILLIAWCRDDSEAKIAALLMPAMIRRLRLNGRSILGHYTVTTQRIHGTTYSEDGNPVPQTYPRDPDLGDQARQARGQASKPLPKDRQEAAEQAAHDGSRTDTTAAPITVGRFLDLWHAVINTGTVDVSTLSGAEVAQLSTGLMDSNVRDGIHASFVLRDTLTQATTPAIRKIVEGWSDTGTHVEVAERLRLLAKRTPDTPAASRLLTMLALRAYCAGHFGLATVAIERARACDPRYGMAALVARMIQAGIEPPA